MFDIWRKHSKNEGISCVIRNKNDLEWVRLGIISIKEFADEIIFVDNDSEDGSLEAVTKLKEDWGLDKLKIFSYPSVDGIRVKVDDYCNFCFGKATKTWVFKWDADFIARTEGLHSIMELKEIWGMNRHKIDNFNLCGPNLFMDHRHYLSDDTPWCYESYLWRNKGYRYVMGPRHEKRITQKKERSLSIGPRADRNDYRTFFFHIQALKPDFHITARKTRSLWWEYAKDTSNPEISYDAWVAEYWGTCEKKEQSEKCMRLFFPNLRLHTAIGTHWGDYPSIMKPYLERPKYEVVYVEGVPASRVTHEDRKIPLPIREIHE